MKTRLGPLKRTARVLCQKRGGRVLLVDQEWDPTQAGLPGGGIEPGETPAAAAVRETYEETGYVCGPLELLMIVLEPNRVTWVFRTRPSALQGKLRSSHEGRAYWGTWGDLARSRFWPFYEVLSACAG